MEIYPQHAWNVSPADAVALQLQLASKTVYNQPLDLEKIKLVAGVDVSVKENAISQAAVVVLRYPEMQVVETVLHKMPTPFPYIPGLLTFREGPVLEHAFRALNHEPDVFIFDGMGRIHPRRMGIAAHLGLWLQRPTIGCGKTPFVGKYTEPDAARGSMSDLTDKGEKIGVVLRTKDKVKPVYISVGHRAELESAVQLVLRCTTKYRLPEPIRAAHNAAGQFAD
jgi:deoxyribonuclease V